MSGPSIPHPYPPATLAVPSTGIIPAFDYWTTIISQYANSPVLDTMISEFNAAMDMTPLIQNFYDMVWNVLTAVGYGLDVWGRIVGVQRIVQIPGLSSYFGFAEASPSWMGFGPSNTGVFFSGGTTTTNIVLADGDFRTLILAKAAANITDGSIKGVNAILLALFPGKQAWVVDNLNMTITYTFAFGLTAVQLAIMTLFAGFVTNAGVAWQIGSIVQLPIGVFNNFAMTDRPARRPDQTPTQFGWAQNALTLPP